MSETQTIVVDDTDPGITYSGDWIADKGSLDNLGHFGAPLMSTSHYTNGTGSFSYTFSGTYVGVFGSSVDGNNPSRVCTVDGATIPNNNITAPANGILHCQVFNLADGIHTLVVTVPTPNPNGYWFDDVLYIPSANVSRANAMVMVRWDDPSFSFGPQWSQNSLGQQVTANGALMSVQFTGRVATWLGNYLNELSAATTATYTIDGGAPMSFDLKAIQTELVGADYNERFFTTGLLSQGPHTLNVTYNGNNSTTPLTIYSIIVQNGASADTSIGGAIGASHPVQVGKSHSHLGAILGAVLGFLGLVLILLLSFVLRRRIRKRRQRNNDNTGVQPFTAPPRMSEVSAAFDNSNSSRGRISPFPNDQFYSDVKHPLPSDAVAAVATSSSAASPAQQRRERPSEPVIQSSRRPVQVSSLPVAANTATAEPEIVVLHEDSGVRIPMNAAARPGAIVVEMPPTYSAT